MHHYCYTAASLFTPNWFNRLKSFEIAKLLSRRTETSGNLKCIQTGQLRGVFMNMASSSSALRETHTCSQILNELPWVIGIVFSFKATQQTSQSFIFSCLEELLCGGILFCLASREIGKKTQFPISIKHSYSRWNVTKTVALAFDYFISAATQLYSLDIMSAFEPVSSEENRTCTAQLFNYQSSVESERK